MTVQTDLQTALDAYIQANYSGSLAEVSAAKKPLEDLLRILDTVTTSGGGGSNAATSTLANVASSATSVSLLAANNNRKTAIIINDSTSDLYVTLNASAASTTNYSLFLAAKVGNTPSFLAINGDDYSGEIRGIWSSANGFARITEVV